MLERVSMTTKWVKCVPLLPVPQVRERDLPMVMHSLSSEFTLLRVVNGEAVAAHDLGVANGFVKPKLGELLVNLGGFRVSHQFLSSPHPQRHLSRRIFHFWKFST